MGTLKDEAQGYKPTEAAKNIAELQSISTNLVVEYDSYEYEGKEIKQKVIVVDGNKYRVPISVLKSLKVILEENPNLKTFKVKKSGEGMKTDYTVIPLA